MEVYKRYASGEHDKQHFSKQRQKNGHIKLRPLSGQFDVHSNISESKSLTFWKAILPQAAFFTGHDPVLFGNVITVLYKNESTSKICAVSISKFGCNLYDNILLDSSSRFWPACENLIPDHRTSNIRKALAIANLKNFNKLWNNKGCLEVPESWDETNAGSLASNMTLIESFSPSQLGEKLLAMDLVQESSMSSIIIDVLYDNDSSEGHSAEKNNSLVSLLGNQIDELFDPLLEYSPQIMDYVYTPPEPQVFPVQQDNDIQDVLNELIAIQTNFTMDLVALLQDFIIPLRAFVLSDVSSTTQGAMKVNIVFPPTIDEVTRINCLLNTSLNVAKDYGYREVFKVLASVLPFFYKAFARHQAVISHFHSRFEKFLKHNRSYVFENQSINKGDYSPKHVENVVLGSLFELPKVKLIVDRLYALSQSLESQQDESLEEHYRLITETIDSLGYGDIEDSNVSQQTRIFTPSGKVLTELATEWPSELQYGWMSRKFVAIYEVKNVMHISNNEDFEEVMIIFSDYLLFLEVRYEESKPKLNLLDVLMNSLINQKPLPNIKNLPALKVKQWCGINELLVKSYESANGQNLVFIAYGENSFRSKQCDRKVYSMNYEITRTDDSVAICNNIMNHISKAQIMNKSTPFHLFKEKDFDLKRYYCAHDLKIYGGENSKSPIVILLHMEDEFMEDVFNKYPHIFTILNLCYLNEHTIQVSGRNRERTFEINEIVSTNDLSASLKEIYANSMDIMFHSSSFIEVLIDSNAKKLDSILRPPNIEASINSFKSTYSSLKGSSKSKELEAKTAEKSGKEQAIDTNIRSEKTFVLRFLRRFKSKSRATQKVNGLREKKSTIIDNTGIPRGKKSVYKKLYKPDPSLGDASTVASAISGPVESSTNDRQSSIGKTVKTDADHDYYKKPEVDFQRAVSTNTRSSSQYSSGSLEKTSNYKFPISDCLGNIAEEHSEADLISAKNSMKGTSKLWDCEEAIYSKDPRCQNTPKSVSPVNIDDSLQPNDTVIVSRKQEDQSVKKSTFAKRTCDNSKNLNNSELNTNKGDRLIDVGSNLTWTESCPKSVKTHEAMDIQTGNETIEALEKLNATGISPTTYTKYKMYDELPLSIITLCDEANWTALIGDSCSNLQAELKALYEVERGANHSSNNTQQGIKMRPTQHPFDSSDDTFSTFEIISYNQVNTPVSSVQPDPKQILAKDQNADDSLKSLSFTDLNQFGLELDRNFSLKGRNSALELSYPKTAMGDYKLLRTLSPETLKDSGSDISFGEETESDVDPKPSSATERILGSSDEEYFSSHELSETIDYLQGGKGFDTYVLTSSSSEKTLMNELDKQSSHNGNGTPYLGLLSHPKNVKCLHDIDMKGLEDFGSLAYLSDILAGNIEV